MAGEGRWWCTKGTRGAPALRGAAGATTGATLLNGAVNGVATTGAGAGATLLKGAAVATVKGAATTGAGAGAGGRLNGLNRFGTGAGATGVRNCLSCLGDCFLCFLTTFLT